MREIKFRAWDKENEVMLKVANIDFEYSLIMNELEEYAYFDDVELMQYTGLKDKNGVGIYEGDIVIIDMKYFDIKGDEGKIIFKDGYFGVQFGCTEEYLKKISAWDSVEVIGNIYENPELWKHKGA